MYSKIFAPKPMGNCRWLGVGFLLLQFFLQLVVREVGVGFFGTLGGRVFELGMVWLVALGHLAPRGGPICLY